MMKHRNLLLSVLGLGFLCGQLKPLHAASSGNDAAAQAKDILAQAGVKGGFVVHVGSGDGKLTAALKATDSYQVHGLDANAENVKTSRENILKTGQYGPVSVDTWNGKDLPYVENSVNLLVLEEGTKVSAQEIDRVLTPLGVSMVKEGGTWKKTQKAWPSELDEWTHYYYDAKG